MTSHTAHDQPDHHHDDTALGRRRRVRGRRVRQSPTDTDPAFEQLLRTRLSQLADHAPTTVHHLDEVRVEHEHRRAAIAGRPAGRRRTAGIGATVAALAGAVGITTVALSGAGTAGAATPEEAVAALLEATQAEDLLGMIDALDPLEVPAVRAAAEAGRGDAVEADLVGEGFRLDGVDGLDVSLTDLSYTTEAVAEGVAVVTVDGSASWSFDPARFPLGGVPQELLGDDRSVRQGTGELGDVSPGLTLATVERDGRWYVSTGYTLADLLRRVLELPVPSGAPLQAVGFATPEDAATAFHRSVLRNDSLAAAAQAPPGEGDAVLRYAPVLHEALVDDLLLVGQVDGSLTLDEITFDATGSGDRRQLVPRTYTISGTAPEPQTFGFYDPSLPTVINALDGIVVLPPGTPLPETLDGFELQDFSASPEGEVNLTWADEDGRVEPLSDLPADLGPEPVTIRRADGCVTVSGPGALTLLTGGFIGPEDVGVADVADVADLGVAPDPIVASVPDDVVDAGTQTPPAAMTVPGYEQVEDGLRTCETNSLVSLVSLIGSGGMSLPPLELVEVDGEWFVSPVGSLGAALVDLLRSVRDEGFFDSPLAFVVLGVDRATLEGFLVGQSLAELPPACGDVSESDDGSTVSRIVDDPDLSTARTCWDGLISGTDSFEMP